MLRPVILDIVKSHCLPEQVLFKLKVIMVQGVCMDKVCLIVLPFHLKDDIEEPPVFIIDLRFLNCK